MRKVMIAAGGSGGHLIPAKQLAQQLMSRGSQVIFGGYQLATSPFFDRSVPFAEISSSKQLSKLIPLGKGVCQALRMIRREKPDVVVGFGSYHTAPILVAAALLRKKIFLYEANRTMGKVNRWMAPFAKGIGIQFPLLGYENEKLVQIPLFPWDGPRTKMCAQEARLAYGLDPNRKTLLVFGGSQGASFLNGVMPEVMDLMSEWQVIHLAGNEAAAETVRKAYPRAALVKAFETNMRQAYSAADFAVCRSGAGTLSELIRFGVPSLLIPYPHAADNHQRMNADYLAQLGGCALLDQKEANAGVIRDRIQKSNVQAMGLALRSAREQNGLLKPLVERVLEL